MYIYDLKKNEWINKIKITQLFVVFKLLLNFQLKIELYFSLHNNLSLSILS